MGALTARSPIESSSANSVAPQPPQLGPLPTNSAAQSALMQGLTNYFNGQTSAAGNPNATPPSMGSSLAQSAGNAIDNSSMGSLANAAGGNASGNGYGSQLMNGLFGSSIPAAAGATDAAGAAAGGGGAGAASAASGGSFLDALLAFL